MTSQASRQIRAVVAANIDTAMTGRDIKNRELADKIGTTEHQVWRWRKGKHVPSLKALGLLAGELFDGDVSCFYVEPDEKAAA